MKMKMKAVGAVRNRAFAVLQAPVGAVLRPQERRRPWPRLWPASACSDSVGSGLRRGVRARLCPRTLVTASSSDRPSRSLLLCHGFRFVVQSDIAPRAPTPWTSRSAREPVVSAADPSPSARRATAAMPTARRRAAQRVVAGRFERPTPVISAVSKDVSTTAIGNAPTAPGAA